MKIGRNNVPELPYLRERIGVLGNWIEQNNKSAEGKDYLNWVSVYMAYISVQFVCETGLRMTHGCLPADYKHGRANYLISDKDSKLHEKRRWVILRQEMIEQLARAHRECSAALPIARAMGMRGKSENPFWIPFKGRIHSIAYKEVNLALSDHIDIDSWKLRALIQSSLSDENIENSELRRVMNHYASGLSPLDGLSAERCKKESLSVYSKLWKLSSEIGFRTLKVNPYER